MDKTTRAARSAALLEGGNTLQAVTCNVSFFCLQGTYREGKKLKRKSKRIQVRVYMKGIYATRSTGIPCPHRDDFDLQTLTIKNDPVNTHRLLGLKNQILFVFNQRLLTNRSLNPSLILDIALGISTHDDEEHYVMGRDKTGKSVITQQAPKPKAITVVEALRRYVEQKEKMLGNGLCERSVYQYQKYGNKLTDFITVKYGKDYPLSHLTPSVEYDLYAHFKGQHQQAHNYVIKVMQFFKVCLTFAHAHGWVDRNVMGAVRFKKERKEVKNLSMEELQLLAQAHFEEEALAQVRDVFLFCCYTGLAWTDVHSLAPRHIIQVEGVDCLQKDRDKSGQQAFIPLFPEAVAILNKYADHPICRIKGVLLPVIYNAKMNTELKRIGQQLGITQKLHTHLGRKSFTMFAESRGFKLDEMAVMMGHSRATMTEKHYHVRRREPIMKVFKELYSEGATRRLAS